MMALLTRKSISQKKTLKIKICIFFVKKSGCFRVAQLYGKNEDKSFAIRTECLFVKPKYVVHLLHS